MNINNSINLPTNSTGWIGFTTSIASTGTSPAKGTVIRDTSYYLWLGKILYIQYSYFQSSAGTAGSGTYLFSVPSGFTINTTITSVFGSSLWPALGSFTSYVASVSEQVIGVPFVFNSTQYGVLSNAGGTDAANDSPISGTFCSLGNANITYSGILVIPIN